VVEETFTSLILRHSDSISLAKEYYDELLQRYSERSRYYHNLDHLNHLLLQILPLGSQLDDMDAVLFALYYHDSVYRVMRRDNEERSAKLASSRLKVLGLEDNRIDRCKNHILATKSHEMSHDTDTNFFTDADLSVLGQDWLTYKSYTEAIRREYAIYPDMIYKPGRKKVIEHFLWMEKIFKTDPFFAKYEQQARINLSRELEALRQ
jgi:predicted metal-dependent HD superfamily phosphohydrolase